MTLEAADCCECPRLAQYLDTVRTRHPTYFAKPVPAFGADNVALLIVGLAPGLHGANRSGRPFTGDHAGILLYETLHRFGFANGPTSSHVSDGLQLIGCRITNAVKCVPPQNKPEPGEIRQCNKYLRSELQAMDASLTVLALGAIAHRSILMALDLKPGQWAFAHGAVHRLPNGMTLFDSYHCSRYNTQTRRLTPQGFADVFGAIKSHLNSQGVKARKCLT